MSKNLTKKIGHLAFEKGLWQKGSSFVVGVSGGPDSVCLLDFLAQLKPKYGLKLIIAHVNYGLRGKESARDELFVRKLAQKYGLGVKILKPKPKEKANENDLREIRYSFFEKIRKANGFDLIAVAHNQDDQVETFLFRLLRGAGLKGLSGMKLKNGHLVRPLLRTSREEILNYLLANKLDFRIDRTNRENLFARNKIRNKLLPFLEKEFNPNIKKTLAESIANIATDDSFIQKAAQKYFQKKYHLSASRLLSLDEALQKRLLFLAIEEAKGNLENIGSGHAREILKALRSSKNKNQQVSFQGLKLIRKGDKVILS